MTTVSRRPAAPAPLLCVAETSCIGQIEISVCVRVCPRLSPWQLTNVVTMQIRPFFFNQVFRCAQHLSVCNKHFDRSVVYTAFAVHYGFMLHASLFLS